MIETGKGDLEIIPSDLKQVRWPQDYHQLQRRITQRSLVKSPSYGRNEIEREINVVPGFENVLGESFGTGIFFNTSESTRQLAFALSVSPSPEIRAALENTAIGPEEMIRAFREKKVLSGIKLIDLGCGNPAFALASRTLGAVGYTVDDRDLPPEVKANLDGHIAMDLNLPDAASRLLSATGGNFDIVSENIIGTVPGTGDNLRAPEPEVITKIGSALLKKGGYLHYSIVRGFRLLQKV